MIIDEQVKNKFLIVKLDQYAGNVDEIVSVALTGWGSERYGREQARKVFDAKVRPLLKNPEDEYFQLPVEFIEFPTEYGNMLYELDSSSTNNLRVGIDHYTDEEMIKEMFAIWGKAYGDDQGSLIITVDAIHNKSVTVKILGFDLVNVIESRTVLR